MGRASREGSPHGQVVAPADNFGHFVQTTSENDTNCAGSQLP